MKHTFLATVVLALAATQPLLAQPASSPAEQQSPNAPFYRPCSPQKYMKIPTYPKARRQNHTDVYHGIKVADPYRWLEDINSRQTKSWIAQENRLTKAYFDSLNMRPAIRAKLDSYQNYARISPPVQKGDRFFYSYNSGLQNHAVIHVTTDLEKPGRVLLDPNTLSKDGTMSVSFSNVSDDGKYLAYGVSDGGSDWNIIYVLNVDTGEKLSDTINWVKFSNATWNKDNSGFYYARFPASNEGDQDRKSVNEGHSLYFHKLGTPQSKDELILNFPEHPDWTLSADVSSDGHWLMATVERTDVNNYAVMVKDLRQATSKFVTLPRAFAAKYIPVDVVNGKAILQTNDNASRFKVVTCDLELPEKELAYKDLIPEQTDALESITRGGNQLFATYSHDAYSQVRTYSLEGKPLGSVPTPGMGTAMGFGAQPQCTDVFYAYTSFTCPATIYRYNLKTGQSQLWKKPELQFNSDDYVTEQVFVTSKDGTKVPMFLNHRKGLKLDGNQPVLMYGYGGFSISLSPSYSTTCAAWMDMGGVYALVNLRGGAEYGEAWHEAGTKLKKQNVFDDFIAAGEWLVANKYTNPQRLAVMGGSNGGLLVGAVLNQRPDLFGAGVAQVGVMDMLRFSKFTIGYAWESDYGDVDKPDEFKALYAISPYHNVKAVDYPATLITTADHDDRVYPAHSFKYAAAMQNAQRGKAPIIIRINTRAGHGAGKPTSMRLDETADILSFLADSLHMTTTP